MVTQCRRIFLVLLLETFPRICHESMFICLSLLCCLFMFLFLVIPILLSCPEVPCIVPNNVPCALLSLLSGVVFMTWIQNGSTGRNVRAWNMFCLISDTYFKCEAELLTAQQHITGYYAFVTRNMQTVSLRQYGQYF